MNHLKPNNNETYIQYIDRILTLRNNKEDNENFQERHHIIPKCMGGSNDEQNLIYLYPQEHYYAHKLLAEENKEINSLQYAWWCMCSTNGEPSREAFITPEEYAEARKRVSELVSKNRRGINNPNYGKKFTEDHRKKIGASKIGKPRPKEVIEKMSKNHADVSGANNPRATQVICTNTGEVFATLSDAAKWCGLKGLSPITNCASGKQKYAGRHPVTNEKLHWKFLDKK